MESSFIIVIQFVGSQTKILIGFQTIIQPVLPSIQVILLLLQNISR